MWWNLPGEFSTRLVEQRDSSKRSPSASAVLAITVRDEPIRPALRPWRPLLLGHRHPLPDGDPIGRGIARHVAVEADPVDRADVALLVVPSVRSKPPDATMREAQVDQISLLAQPTSSFAQLRAPLSWWTNVLRRKHELIVQNRCSLCQYLNACQFLSPRPAHTPLFQAFLTTPEHDAFLSPPGTVPTPSLPSPFLTCWYTRRSHRLQAPPFDTAPRPSRHA